MLNTLEKLSTKTYSQWDWKTSSLVSLGFGSSATLKVLFLPVKNRIKVTSSLIFEGKDDLAAACDLEDVDKIKNIGMASEVYES